MFKKCWALFSLIPLYLFQSGCGLSLKDSWACRRLYLAFFSSDLWKSSYYVTLGLCNAHPHTYINISSQAIQWLSQSVVFLEWLAPKWDKKSQQENNQKAHVGLYLGHSIKAELMSQWYSFGSREAQAGQTQNAKPNFNNGCWMLRVCYSAFSETIPKKYLTRQWIVLKKKAC